MKRKQLILGAFMLASQLAGAQVTDPMITGWWFNTTGHTYHGILTDVETVYYTSTYVYVKASDVPNYYADGVSVNNAADQHATWEIPRTPVPATTGPTLMGGQSGLMLDGSVCFTPGDAQSYMGAGIWNRLAYYFERPDMDAANGHSTPTNMYHHHFDNLKLHNWDSTHHSPIVGYAWDGYPIYGPYAYANTDGTGGIKRMRSGYQTYTYTTRTSGPAVGGTYPIGCFIEDWHFVSGSGDLDAHNGRFCKTPEYPSGTYAYFTTVDASLNPVYPYFIGPTFYGTVDMSNVGPSGGHSTVPGGATVYTPPMSTQIVSAIESNISLYPIPVTDHLTIGIKENKEYTITVYGLKGNVISTQKITATTKIDMSNFAYGVYFVQVDDPTTNTGFIRRIVKQ